MIFLIFKKKKKLPKNKLNEKIAHEKEFNLSNDKKLFIKYNLFLTH